MPHLHGYSKKGGHLMATTVPTGETKVQTKDLTDPTLGEKASELLDSAGNSVKAAADTAREAAATAKEKAGAHVASGKAAAQRGYAQGSQAAAQASDEFLDAVRRNPWIALGGALGVGIAVGLLVNQKR
jgi:ElaB/YqjD/DUF883 family membrane-anchored ribosome-binding protein